MKSWKHSYGEEDLLWASDVDVRILAHEDDEIVAEVDGENVEVPICFHTPCQMSCTCKSTHYPCRHMAAVMFHIERHDELLNSPNVEELVEGMDERILKEFVICEIRKNEGFKNDFLRRFNKENIIDDDEYVDRLNSIFRPGMDPNIGPGVYYLERIEHALCDFMENDISSLMSLKKHALVSKLLGMIGEMLGDEMLIGEDSWYVLAEELMEWDNLIYDSIYLTLEDLSSYGAATSVVREYYD